MSEDPNLAKDPASMDIPRIETATIEDLEQITELVMELLEIQHDFVPDREIQENGLRLILESPSKGRIFVLRNDHRIIGIVNLLFTISTAVGGMVILLEDFIIHPDFRSLGYGARLLTHVKKFAKKKKFIRIRSVWKTRLDFLARTYVIDL